MPDKSLVLYTRRHLARNHLLAPQPITYCRLPPIDPITDIRDPFSFSPCEDLDGPKPGINCSEKLILDYETAIYLSSILETPDEGNSLFEDFRWSTTRRIEEPLVKEQRRRKVHRVREELFESAPVDLDNDSGILWDRSVRTQVWEFLRDSEVERMVISPEVLEYLQSIHRPETPPSTMDVVREELKYCKPTTSKLMTPPLLSSSPVIHTSLPKLAEMLDLKPIDPGRTASLIDDLTASFMAADAMLIAPPESPSSFLQLSSPIPSPIRKRPRAETLMVEAMLTPPASTVKKVRFSDLELPPRIATPENGEVDNKLDEIQILVRVDQELAQEQLQEADSTLRIEVPVMDFSRPTLPWEGLGDGLERIHDLKSWAGMAARKWVGSEGIGINLPWRPFVKSTAKAPIEELEDEGFIDEMVVIGDGDEGERNLMESLRGLRLGKLEDNIELEPGIFTEKMDLKALVERKKKRKRPGVESPLQTVVKGGEGGTEKNLKDAALLSANPLDTFMALRSRVAKSSEKASVSISRVIRINPESETALGPIIQTKPEVTPEIAAFPTPDIQLPLSPGTFIVSTTLLAERCLFRLIKDLYPTAIIVERDFSVSIPDTFAGITSTKHDDTEADLILSPLSGVIITSLQKIRQAPLQGQALSTIRQRVMNIALMYERLFVIVLGNVRGSDAETVAGFIGFAAGLRSGVHIRVLDEDWVVVAKWVVALMIREGVEAKLLDEETLWERFLRKAGFNAFSAQVVLRDCRDGGLRAFLKMDTREKQRRFKAIVGDMVLQRVLGRLEAEWGGFNE